MGAGDNSALKRATLSSFALGCYMYFTSCSSPTIARHYHIQVLTCQATTGQDIPSSLARVSVALATSPASLFSALQQLPALAPGLVVVDCLTTPVMPLVTDNSLQAAFALGSRAAQLLLRAADGGAAGG